MLWASQHLKKEDTPQTKKHGKQMFNIISHQDMQITIMMR